MASSLTHRCVFGASAHVANSMSYSEEGNVLYVAGHNLVLLDPADRRQRFIHGTEGYDGITALAVCPSRRFVALAEAAEKPSVHVYDLRTLRIRKKLQHADLGAREYVALAFSHDDNLLITQSAGPAWTLICWNWVKVRALCAVRTSDGAMVRQIGFSPIDAAMACVCGDGIFRFYRFLDSSVRGLPPPKAEGHNYLCCAWLHQPEDHVVAGTDAGSLAIFRAGDFVGNLNASPGAGVRVTALAICAIGFVAGLSDGAFRLYTLASEGGVGAAAPRLFECVHSWRLATSAYITSIAVCPAEDRVSLATADNQLWGASLSAQARGGRNEDPKPLTFSFHAPEPAAAAAAAAAGAGGTGGNGGSGIRNAVGNMGTNANAAGGAAGSSGGAASGGGGGGGVGGVTGLDCCHCKPLAITCGADHTVRIWNFEEQTLELCKSFGEEPCSAAFHPTGLHVAVGFADKLRLMNVLMEDLRTYRELPIKQCRELRFSGGGHRLAAVNGNIISVYDFYTLDKVCDLRGHNSKVRHVAWGAHDRCLISCGQDGAVYQWDPDDGRRLGELVNKGVTYTCGGGGGGSSGGASSIFAVGSDRMLRELEAPDMTVAKELDSGAVLGQIALTTGEHAMLAGTAEPGRPGCVRSYTFPLTGDY
ncbi:unnamed protein product, partial [Phaeothamnion confervicola]